jgi:hypothetical protein
MFEATDGLISHTRQNTIQPELARDTVGRDPTRWNSPERNRKITAGAEAKTDIPPQGKISSSVSKNECEKIKDFYRATGTDYLTQKAI